VGQRTLAAFRQVETAFWSTGDTGGLDRMDALLSGALADATFASASRAWVLLMRHDRFGDDATLETAGGVFEALPEDQRWMIGVPVLLRHWWRDGGLTDLDRAIRLGDQPAGVASSGPGPLWQSPAWRACDQATALLERYRFTGDDADLRAAADLVDTVRVPGAAPPLRILVLHARAVLDHEAYLRDDHRRLLERAIRRYRRALDLAPPSAVLRPTLLTELGTALQDRFAEDDDPADLAEAVAFAAEAVRTEQGRAERASHLVNLGTAHSLCFEETTDPDDLTSALRAWQEALEELPARSPYRPAFLDRLAIGHLTRWESVTGTQQDLQTAIAFGRGAVAHEGSPDLAVYQNHLAFALEYRWQADRDPQDLHEAVRVMARASEVSAGLGARAPDLLANLAHLLLTRYEALGRLDDVAAALAALARLSGTDLGRKERATVAASQARALRVRYQATGDDTDLEAALRAARASLRGVDPPSQAHSSRVSRVAVLLYLRYVRHGRGGDLDEAIRILRGACRQAPSGHLFGTLSSCLLQRYLRTGEIPDRDEAIQFSHDAVAAEDPPAYLLAAAADARHERFITEGSLAELEDAVQRQRNALADLEPGSPLMAVVLHNLGVMLQDRFDYHGDEAALDEAVDLHEQAVAVCQPSSPDLPGLLDSLVAALRLRFDHYQDPADLDRAAELGRRALRVLGPKAPDRPHALANLASVLLTRARGHADQDAVDDAIGFFREALREYPAHRPDRSVVLTGYAQALAERHSVSRGQRGRAMVLRAFRNAVDASTDAPVQRIDIAGVLGRWAADQGLWPVAADAYWLATQARRTLAAGQIGFEQRSAWLAYGEDLAVSETLARIHSGRLHDAVVALEAGRALTLAASLDTRTVSARLRARHENDLADRYEDSAARFSCTLASHDGSRSLPVG
jgi:tetratricopeptide (TPR) repeat protein